MPRNPENFGEEQEEEVKPEAQQKELVRKERYFENLKNFQNENPEKYYPEEMKKLEWIEVTDQKELEKTRKSMKSLSWEIPDSIYGLYRDKSGEHSYYVYRYNNHNKLRELLLDMLATSKEIAPWAKQKGLIKEKDMDMFKEKCGQWTFVGNLVQYDGIVMEQIVNGLGDPKYTKEQKQTFLRDDISAIVHENTHINNTDSLDFGGTARKITETAPMAEEYLAFPGKNSKMRVVTENARKLLRGEQERPSYYNDATLMGMLVMANDEGFLPEEEDVQRIDEGLASWKSKVESLSREKLSEYRKKVEEEWLLSNDDVKLHGRLLELKYQYPNIMKKIIGDYKLKGEKQEN